MGWSQNPLRRLRSSPRPGRHRLRCRCRGLRRHAAHRRASGGTPQVTRTGRERRSSGGQRARRWLLCPHRWPKAHTKTIRPSRQARFPRKLVVTGRFGVRYCGPRSPGKPPRAPAGRRWPASHRRQPLTRSPRATSPLRSPPRNRSPRREWSFRACGLLQAHGSAPCHAFPGAATRLVSGVPRPAFSCATPAFALCSRPAPDAR